MRRTTASALVVAGLAVASNAPAQELAPDGRPAPKQDPAPGAAPKQEPPTGPTAPKEEPPTGPTAPKEEPPTGAAAPKQEPASGAAPKEEPASGAAAPKGDAASSAEADEKANATQTNTVLSREKIGVEGRVDLEEAEAKRRAWKERGGLLFSYEGRGLFTTSIGDYEKAYGGGAGVRIGLVGLSAPNAATDKTTWLGFRVGVGYNFTFLSGSSSTGASFSATTAQLPFALGGYLGLGSFHDDGKWKGVVLGLAWAPAFSSSKPSNGNARGTFSYTGFDLTIDYTSLEARLDALATSAHLRFSVFALPPIESGSPWIAQVGLGAVVY